METGSIQTLLTLMDALPKEYWPNTHNNDRWFTGDLIEKEEVKDHKRNSRKTRKRLDIISNLTLIPF